jgi:hypothetical protein
VRSAGDLLALLPIAVEGAIDFVSGRPRERNPYSPLHPDAHAAWAWGYDDAQLLLEARGQETFARSLGSAA